MRLAYTRNNALACHRRFSCGLLVKRSYSNARCIWCLYCSGSSGNCYSSFSGLSIRPTIQHSLTSSLHLVAQGMPMSGAARHTSTAASSSGMDSSSAACATPSPAESTQTELVKNIDILLRNAGPMPVSTAGSMLDDDTMESVSEHVGGLAGFCRTHPEIFIVRGVPGGANVLLHRSAVFPAATASDSAGDGDSGMKDLPSTLIVWALALLAAAQYIPRSLSPPLPNPPTVLQLLAYLRRVCPAHCPPTVGDLASLLGRLPPSVCLLVPHPRKHSTDTDDPSPLVMLASAYPQWRDAHPSNSAAASFAVGPVAEITTPTSSEAYSEDPQLRRALKEAIPSTFFVPLQHVLKHTSIRDLDLSSSSYSAIAAAPLTAEQHLEKALRSLPTGIVDIRELNVDFKSSALPSDEKVGNGSDSSCKPLQKAVWVRFIGLEKVLASEMTFAGRGSSCESDDDTVHKYSVHAVGTRIIEELDAYVNKGCGHRLRMLKGLNPAQLAELLSPVLLRDALSIFYERSDAVAAVAATSPSAAEKQSLSSSSPASSPSMGGYQQTADFRALLLICDRFRHLLDVNFNAATVRPWCVLPLEEQPGSLMWATTPLPRVLWSLLHILEHNALSPLKCFGELPRLERRQLLRLYAGIEETVEQLASNDVHDKAGAAALITFVSQHSLYVMMNRRDGLLYTPFLIAEARRRERGNMNSRRSNFDKLPNSSSNSSTTSVNTSSDRFKSGASAATFSSAGRSPSGTYTAGEKALMIHNALPHSPTLILSLENVPTIQQLPFSLAGISPSLYTNYPTLFKVYEPFAMANNLVVGRATGRPPKPEQLFPARSLDSRELLKLIAMLSVGGAHESAIMCALPRSARVSCKSGGGVAALVAQLPMWFQVHRDTAGVGDPLITYIGATETPSGTEKIESGVKGLRDAGLGLDVSEQDGDENEDAEWERRVRDEGYEV